jgi:hypothetical protein
MAFQIQYASGGNTYNISNQSPAFPVHYLGDENFGMAPLHMITSRSPVQHGDTTLDFRLDPRIIQIPLLVECETLQEQYDQRNYLLQMFKPSNQDGTLIVTYPDGRQRYITTRILGGLDFNMETSAGHSIRAVVRMRCSDPTWYDPNQITLPIVTISGTPTVYPKIYATTYGTSSFGGEYDLTYTGTWLSYPIITVTGPVTNFSITNTSSNQNITLVAGTVIAAGSTLRFDLRYGFKTVQDQTGANKIGLVDSSSELAQFAIFPAPDVPDAINTLVVTGTGTTTASSVALSYYNRYIGI